MMRNIFRTLVITIFALAGIIFFRNFTMPPVSVKAVIDKRSALVGDRIRYSIKIVSNANIDVDIPGTPDGLDGFEVLDEGLNVKRSFGKEIAVKWYLMTLYQPGDYIIPGREIAYTKPDGEKGVLSTKELSLSIASISGDQIVVETKIAIGGGLAGKKIKGKPGDTSAGPLRKIDAPIFFRIKEVKEPVRMMFYTDMVIPAAIVLLITVFVLIFFLVMRKKKKREPVPLLPREEAIKRLNDLEAKIPPEGEKLKESYFELSSILREYLKTFLVKKEEITTGDFFTEIDKMQELSEELKNNLKNLLSMCDRMKYSGQILETRQWQESLRIAKSMFEVEVEKV